jgi:hypothetical protein
MSIFSSSFDDSSVRGRSLSIGSLRWPPAGPEFGFDLIYVLNTDLTSSLDVANDRMFRPGIGFTGIFIPGKQRMRTLILGRNEED